MSGILERMEAHDGQWVNIANGEIVTVTFSADEDTTFIYIDSKSKLRTIKVQDFAQSFVEKPNKCCVCGTTENLFKDGWHGYRCTSADCACF